MERVHATGGRYVELALVSAASLFLASSALTGRGPGYVAPLMALVALLIVWRPTVIAWRNSVVALLLIVLFIPIRRYTLSFHLPFQLEPYRCFVLLLAAAWAGFLLLDQRLRVRATGLEAPLALLAVAVLGSIVTNYSSITDEDLSTEIVKKLTFWIGFMLVLYLIVSVSRVSDVELYLRVLVVGAAVLGAFAVAEWKTGHNAFSHLNAWLPGLSPVATDVDTFRAGLHRAYTSAQHPIAFGAALAMILPVAAAYALRRQRTFWYVCAALIVLGSLASVSRTSLVMLLAGAAILGAQKPKAARMALPYLLPLLIAIQLALPGTFATMRAAFFPKEGLVEQQAAQQVGSGRVASFGPAMEELSHHPLFGRGFGTRIVEEDDPKRNSFILDDEWLSTTLELGIAGFVAWTWLLVRFCLKARRTSAVYGDDDDRGWLLAALCASVGAFAVGMLFFDAFSFIQATMLLVVLIGVGSVLMRPQNEDAT